MSAYDFTPHSQISSDQQWPSEETSESQYNNIRPLQVATSVRVEPSDPQTSSQRKSVRLSLVPATDDEAAKEQVHEIRREIARLQALERGISKSSKSFTLSDQEGNHNSGRTSFTTASETSSPELQEHVAKLKRRVERLKGWEEYLKSSGSFKLAEDEELETTRRRSNRSSN